MDIYIKRSVIMEMTNDDKILQLKNVIKKKKEELKKYRKFCPVTMKHVKFSLVQL